jgi:hypothetical protein
MKKDRIGVWSDWRRRVGWGFRQTISAEELLRCEHSDAFAGELVGAEVDVADCEA